MSGLTKRAAVIAEERMAEAQGRDVRRCDRCGEVGAHYEAARLDDAGLVVAGRYICEVRA